MAAYYNEIEPYAADWLEHLIRERLIATGVVDRRSIVDVEAKDLRDFTQCHFFAGIGGWSYALRLAGWPDDGPVWTGSCPCQPFSTAGKQRGSEDERHLWPAFFRLIRECRPATVFGEQVASAAGLAWLDHVCADLEGEGYAAAAADLPAAGVGAPHGRARLYWMAYASERGCTLERAARIHDCRQSGNDAAGCGTNGVRLADSTDSGHRARRNYTTGCGESSCDGLLGHADGARLQRRELDQAREQWQGPPGPAREPSCSFWADLEWLSCSDGKARPTQPGIFPLAHGIPGRVGRLRAYGNAIVPQVAAEFIAACVECSV